MANGIYRHGKIEGLDRQSGIGIIRPDDDGRPVIFPAAALPGGRAEFDQLRPGQRVDYLSGANENLPVEIAMDVYPKP